MLVFVVGLMGRSHRHERNFGDRRLKAKWASLLTVFGQEQKQRVNFYQFAIQANGQQTFWRLGDGDGNGNAATCCKGAKLMDFIVTFACPRILLSSSALQLSSSSVKVQVAVAVEVEVNVQHRVRVRVGAMNVLCFPGAHSLCMCTSVCVCVRLY